MKNIFTLFPAADQVEKELMKDFGIKVYDNELVSFHQRLRLVFLWLVLFPIFLILLRKQAHTASLKEHYVKVKMGKVINNVNVDTFYQRENTKNDFIKIDSTEIRYGKSLKPVHAN